MFLISQFVVKELPRKGRGVFATSDIEWGTIVGDYLGTLIRSEEEDELKNGLYCMTFDDRATIQADPASVGIHLINHSCAPNVGMYSYSGRTFYFALRKIYSGEEITVSYYLGSPDEHCNPCGHICHCGTPLCCGSMHCSEEEADAFLAYDGRLEDERGFSIETKLPVAFGEALPRLGTYPKRIVDGYDHPLYANLNKEVLACDDSVLPSVTDLRKKIQETGQMLEFKKLGVIVEGVRHDRIIIRSNR